MAVALNVQIPDSEIPGAQPNSAPPANHRPAGTGPWPARLAAGFFVGFAGFQLALALGAPLGAMAWSGSSTVLPPALRWSSAAAGAVLVAASAVMLIRSGDLGRWLPQRLFWWINAVLVVQLALNTLANLVSASPPERMVMAPASAIGCVLCIWALALHRR